MNEFVQYYGYRNRGITPAVSACNGLHTDLYNKGLSQGILVNFVKPTDTFRSIFIGEIISNRDCLDTEISFASMQELRSIGLQLSPDSYKRHKSALIVSYILNSALCYLEMVKTKGRTSFFATKNPLVINAMSHTMAPLERKKKLKDFALQLSTSVQEITEGTFKVVALRPDVGGIHLSKERVNYNSKHIHISTMYAVGLYNDAIVRYLKKNLVNIAYFDDVEQEQKLLTTSLLPKLTAKWLGTNEKTAANRVIEENSQDIYSLGNLILPDYNNRGEFVTVPILSIRSIQNVN